MNRISPERRREAVARLLRRGHVGTQEALLPALRREGFRATQATLSRDLARLGARRVSRPEGGAVYELSDEAPDAGLAALRGLVGSVSANGSLVVVRTRPGSAPAVARAIDLARLDGVLGTIAGDDTIFVAPSRERRGRGLAARLGTLLGAPVVPALIEDPGNRRARRPARRRGRYPAETRRHSDLERATQSSMASPSK